MKVKDLRELLYNFKEDSEVKVCRAYDSIEEGREIELIVGITTYFEGGTEESVAIKVAE